MNTLNASDALRHLERYKDDECVDDLAVVEQFLRSLLDPVEQAEKAAAAAAKPRYIVVDNVGGQPSGYELVDTSAIPPCTFAIRLREEFAVEIARRLNEGNKARRALLRAVNDLEEMGFDDDDEISGADTVDVVCQLYPIMKAALK